MMNGRDQSVPKVVSESWSIGNHCVVQAVQQALDITTFFLLWVAGR